MILPILAKLELLLKFLTKIIANLPDAKPILKIINRDYPRLTREITKPKRIKSPKVKADVP